MRLIFLLARFLVFPLFLGLYFLPPSQPHIAAAGMNFSSPDPRLQGLHLLYKLHLSEYVLDHIRYYLIFTETPFYSLESDMIIYSSEVVCLFILWSLSMLHISITGQANDA